MLFQVPEEIASNNLWELMTGYAYKLLSPFQLDKTKVPVLPKKFTCVFERNKEYLLVAGSVVLETSVIGTRRSKTQFCQNVASSC